MISYEAALELLRQASYFMGSESIFLSDAYDRILSDEVIAPINSPPFDNSAMDGFALCSSTTINATDVNQIRLLVSDKIGAGDHSQFFGENSTIKIMTGAPLPLGYDAVIPVEEAACCFEDGKEYLYVKRTVRPKENIRFSGEDFKKNDYLLRAGTKLREKEMLVLATAGLGTVTVFKKPSVALLSTGNELVDDYQAPLAEGQIYNTNRIYLMNALKVSGVDATYHGCILDDKTAYQEAIEKLVSSKNTPTIIVSTGSVSKGDYDFIPDVLKTLGFSILFHKVNIRPGKPILFARLGSIYYFGLPGNPISACVGFSFFLKPFIDMLMGKTDSSFVFAKLTNSFQKKGQFVHFLKAKTSFNQDGQLLAEVLPGQESFKVFPMIEANAWIYAQEETRSMTAGQLVRVFL